MLKPIKQAYLKHDLFKVIIPTGTDKTGYTLEEITDAISKISYRKIASKGMKFVWCQTQLDPNGRLIPMDMGWFADAGTNLFVSGNCGFGQMSSEWGNEHLTDPVPYQKLTNKESINTQEFL